MDILLIYLLTPLLMTVIRIPEIGMSLATAISLRFGKHAKIEIMGASARFVLWIEQARYVTLCHQEHLFEVKTSSKYF